MIGRRRKRPSAARGLAAGLIGGVVASWVMECFQDGLAKLSHKEQKGPEASQEQRPRAANAGAAEASEPATVKLAVAVAEDVFQRPLAPATKPAAGAAVHYAFGTLVGGAYGLAAERLPLARRGAGSLFGSGLWLASDEIAVPAFGLAGPPQAYPFKVHASALAAHVVYGATLEVVRRALRGGFLAS